MHLFKALIVKSASLLMPRSSGRGCVWQTKVGMPTSTIWVVDSQKWCRWKCALLVFTSKFLWEMVAVNKS